VEPVEQSTMTAEQQACESHFITHTTQQQDGRFVVKLPTKMDPKQLGSSRLSAERRLHAIEHRLERDPKLKVQYHNFMKEYEELGHMEPVKSQEGKQTYLILSDCSVQLSLPTKYFYRNCGRTNYSGMNYFLLICNKNGISCFRTFLNSHKSR